MADPIPPQIELALRELQRALQQVERKDLDPLTAPWAEIEKGVIKLLKGPFKIQEPEHQVVAMGLAGIFGGRLARDHGAFWFMNRDSLEGVAMGFPEAVMVLSPFGAAMEALRQGRLERLEEMSQEIRKSLAQVKFSPTGAGGRPQRLRPEDYERLFDPALVQFLALDQAKAQAAWDSTPEKLSRDIRDALSRTGQLPAQAKESLQQQMLGALQALDPQKPVSGQVERAPQVAELIGHLFAGVEGTGFAPEEFWQEIALPLLFIGTPENFPPVDGQELQAFAQGADPLVLFVDLVPHQTPAPEEGLLGAFPVEDVELPHPGFNQSPALRLMRVKLKHLGPLLKQFDPAKTQQALGKFTAYLEQKAGKAGVKTGDHATTLEAALSILSQLKKVAEGVESKKLELYMRRATEVEASSDGALSLIRAALSAPRIILA